jgi:thymidylate kinase
MNIRPYFVEVLGTPEAGKTTTIKEVTASLSNKGIAVKYIQESAEIVPVEFVKGSIEAHLWMRLHTLQQILLASISNAEIVIVDRGILDTLFWDSLFFQTGKLSKSQLDSANNFFESFSFMPNLAIILTASPEEAIIRRGGEGRIVTKKFIENFNTALKTFCKEEISIPKVEIDTTMMSVKSVFESVENAINLHFHK